MCPLRARSSVTGNGLNAPSFTLARPIECIILSASDNIGTLEPESHLFAELTFCFSSRAHCLKGPGLLSPGRRPTSCARGRSVRARPYRNTITGDRPALSPYLNRVAEKESIRWKCFPVSLMCLCILSSMAVYQVVSILSRVLCKSERLECEKSPYILMPFFSSFLFSGLFFYET